MTKKRLKKFFICFFLLYLVFSPLANLALAQNAGFASSTSSSVNVGVSVTCPGGICAFQGCTDPKALNYNPKATHDDGSCKYKEQPPQIPGCTDPQALNYNPDATQDDGSCEYKVSVPNVSNFQATYSNGVVRLTWTNPSFNYFSGVVIVRSSSGIPTSPSDGETIYQGSGTSASDSNVEAGKTYNYVAFVKATYNDTSSGALASIQIPGVTPTPTETPLPSGATPAPTGTALPPGVTPPGGGGGGTPTPTGGLPGYNNVVTSTTSPFDQLPQAEPTNEQIKVLSIKRFIFSQPGERDKSFDEGSAISINGSKELTISLPYSLVPEVLKTIGVTIYDPDNANQSFSFLLQLNDAKTAYEATIAPLRKDGSYGVSIYILNYQDQTMKRLNGKINVYGSLGEDQLASLARGVAPIALSGGVAIGTTQLIVTTSSVASLSDVYLLLLRQLGALLGYVGIRRKKKPWGTVYDSVTKRPIDPAYVTVQDLSGKEVGSAITDIDGRYGFFLPPGEYKVAAQKTHYQFPSTYLQGRIADELYDNLYFGDPVKTQGEEVLNLNIPLDPLGFDWNEFVKSKTDYFKIHGKRDVLKARILNTVYIIGFLSAIGYFVFEPSWMNIFIFLFYLGMYSFQYFWRLSHKVITASLADTGDPLSFAIIRMYYADINQEVKKVVADALGRFYVLVRPGTYYLTIEEKQSDSTYQKVYQSEPMELKKGVLEKNILVKISVATAEPPVSTMEPALVTVSNGEENLAPPENP